MVYCIIGPTASGKTGISIELAKLIGGEIVSADSVQVYRGFDIGSAKPSLLEQQGIRHHLIDCVDPGDTAFSVGRYRELAAEAIADITSRGKTPIICGGSGLYVDALLRPLNFALPSEPAVREELSALYPESQPEAAYEALKAVDSETAARLHPNDRKRILRALEVYRISGRTLSSFGNDFKNGGEEAPLVTADIYRLDMERSILYERIEQRVDHMLEAGLIDEVRALRINGYADTAPMQSLDYRQINEYLEGSISLEDAVADIKLQTRHFAKRQISWFKRYENAFSIPLTGSEKAWEIAARIVSGTYQLK